MIVGVVVRKGYTDTVVILWEKWPPRLDIECGRPGPVDSGVRFAKTKDPVADLADISRLNEKLGAKLPLDVHIELLHVSIPERLAGRGDKDGINELWILSIVRKWICSSRVRIAEAGGNEGEWQDPRRIVCHQRTDVLKAGRVEYSVGCTHDIAATSRGIPSHTNPRREIIFVRATGATSPALPLLQPGYYL